MDRKILFVFGLTTGLGLFLLGIVLWRLPTTISFLLVFLGFTITLFTLFITGTPTKAEFDDNDFDDSRTTDEILGLIPGALNPDDDLDNRRDY